MRETQANIKKYQEQLIGLKSKLAAVGLFFVMSIAMFTTASFAWIVLSTAPEVSNISTTIVGNGNLEIALAEGDEEGFPKIPNESKAGDSNLESMQKNLTWGNLINLSNENYGLGSASLRPATINYTNILESPLLAVTYSKDGRFLETSYDFSYTTYNSAERKFTIPNVNAYGVRAISAVKWESSDAEALQKMQKIYDLKSELGESTTAYYKLVNNDNYINSISTMMGTFLTDKLNGSDTTLDTNSMKNFRNMVNDFLTSLNLLGDVYVEAANIQIEELDLSLDYYSNFDQLRLNETEASMAEKGIELMPGFDNLKKDIAKVSEIVAHIDAEMKETDGVKLSEILDDINYIVDINSCELDADITDDGIPETLTIPKLSTIGKSKLLKLLGGGPYPARITKGALKDYEQLTAAKLQKNNLKIQAKYSGIPATVSANISTTATSPFTIPSFIEGGILFRPATDDNYNSIHELVFKSASLIAKATDVYGMAIDLWFRTNVEESYLILEGEADIQLLPLKTNKDYLVFEDIDGVKFYYKHVTALQDPTHDQLISFQNTEKKDDEEIGYRLFQDHIANKLLDGEFYNYETGQKIVFPDDDSTTTDKDENMIARNEFILTLRNYAIKTKVIGYDGVNRVWEESTDLVGGESVTQGKGSCFIFYPKDPIEQESMLKVLRAFSVTFIDNGGKIFATAILNTEHAYEESGKVIVPLELKDTSPQVKDENGNMVHYITELTQNEAQFVSAVVYIDGAMVSNTDVSATQNINGYLNMQFGSTKELNGLEDKELQNSFISINAAVDPSTFGTDTTVPKFHFTADINGLDVDEAYIILNRQVNKNQGVREAIIDLTYNEGGMYGTKMKWGGEYTLTTPGTYVIRSIWADGMEYDLPQPLTITYDGLNIGAINWNLSTTENELYVMTSKNSYPVEIRANLTASQAFTPTKVEALFRNEYNEYMTVNLQQSGSQWIGSGNFITSGTYTLEYIRVNDEIFDVSEDKQKIIHLSLGLYAEVQLSNTSFTWTADETELDNNIVTVNRVNIYDNKGKELIDLNDVSIEYLRPNSNDPLSADLTRVGDAYVGEFNVLTPGIYSFSKIVIGNSEVTKAENAVDITARSPYPVSFIDGAVPQTIEYQFEPIVNVDNETGAYVTMDIRDSETSTVVGKLKHTYTTTNSEGEKVTNNTYYYVNGINDATVDSTDGIGKDITTWKFIPTYKNTKDELIQDGQWTLEEVYISDAYYNGEWISSELAEDSTVENWYESEDNRIVYDVEDTTFNVLTDVYINVANTHGNYNNTVVTTFRGPFTDSLSSKYTATNYSITYNDYYGNTLDNSVLNNYGIKVYDTNTVNYIYTPDSDVQSWWLNVGNNKTSADIMSAYKTEVDSKSIKLQESSSMVFKYPGKYEPISSIKMTFDNNDYTITPKANGSFGSNSGFVTTDFIHVTYNIPTETVYWDQPDAKFVAVSPSGEHTVSSDDKSVTGLQINAIKEGGIVVTEGHQLEIWFDAKYTAHNHDDNCVKSTNCGKTEHTHSCPGCCTRSGWHLIHRYCSSEEHTHENSCYTVTKCSNILNTGFTKAPSKATVELFNAGAYTSATLMIDSNHGYLTWDGYVETDVTYDFNTSTNKDTKNIGIFDSDGLNAGTYPTKGDNGAQATTVDITYNNNEVYKFTLKAPLVVNKENEGGY